MVLQLLTEQQLETVITDLLQRFNRTNIVET